MWRKLVANDGLCYNSCVGDGFYGNKQGDKYVIQIKYDISVMEKCRNTQQLRKTELAHSQTHAHARTQQQRKANLR